MPRLDPEDLEMMLSTLRSYAKRELTREYLLSLDCEEQFPRKVFDDLYDPDQVGLHLLFIDEEYGGLGGGAGDVARVSEVLAGVDLGISTGILATFLGTDPIAVGGTEDQKERWMGRIAEEGLLVAYGATEPQAGSDLGALSTRATPEQDDEGNVTGYRISGQKQWISNGGVADLYTVLALTPGGPSWFVVEQGAEGFTSGNPEDKHGIRASNTAALFLDEVQVPASALVGEVEGQGLVQAQAVFAYTRLMVAAFGLGAGWDALARAIRYSQERIQAGSPLCEKQAFTHKLIVPNAAQLEAARAYIQWTADRIDDGEPDLATEGAVAKYLATEAGNRAAEDAIQAHGGYGYIKEYMVEKIKRDVRITTIYEGTSEIMEQTIARGRWQQHLKSRAAFYPDWAARLEGTDGGAQTGVDAAVLGLRALSAVLERCREYRLTRDPHVLFRLGELVTWAEAAAVFSERAAAATGVSEGGLDADTLKALARIFARDAAHKVASQGLRWTAGATAGRGGDLSAEVNLSAVVSAQAGLVQDMTLAADGLRKAFPADA